MDEDTRDLVRKLCTRAGMIMEDASLVAVTMPGGDDAAMAKAIELLARDAAAIIDLVSAAAALLRREADPS